MSKDDGELESVIFEVAFTSELAGTIEQKRTISPV